MERMLSDILIENHDAIWKRAALLTRNVPDIDDLVQDLAEKIWSNDAPAYKFEQPLAYFSKIMRNKMLDELRKQKQEAAMTPDMMELYAKSVNTDDLLESKRMGEIIREEFSNLSLEMQEAFMMVYFDGYRVDEVAKMLGISSNLLSQRFRRFRLRLEQQLSLESIAISMIIAALMNLG